MNKRTEKIREELASADAQGLIHPPYAASDVRSLIEQISALTILLGEKEVRIAEVDRDYADASGRIVALQEREKVLIQRLQSHGDIETDKEEALRGGE